LLSEIRENDAKEKLIEGAWIGFQLGAGGDMNFGNYLRKMGLMEGAIEDKITAEQAKAKAQEILRKARLGRAK
jgi:hypothetical protein